MNRPTLNEDRRKKIQEELEQVAREEAINHIKLEGEFSKKEFAEEYSLTIRVSERILENFVRQGKLLRRKATIDGTKIILYSYPQ